MSTKASFWAAGQRDLGPGERWVLWWLADYSGTDGRAAWPSVATLARNVGQSPRAVQQHLKALEVGGYIVRGDQSIVRHVPANRRPIVYDVNLGRRTSADLRLAPALPTPAEDARGAIPAPQNLHPKDARGETIDVPGVQEVQTTLRTEPGQDKDAAQRDSRRARATPETVRSAAAAARAAMKGDRK